MKFVNMLKKIFVDHLWIKAIAIVLAVVVAVIINAI